MPYLYEEPRCDLVLVPTADLVGELAWPGDAGVIRINKAFELLSTGIANHIGFPGYQKPYTDSPIYGYSDYFADQYCDFARRDIRIKKYDRCSARDILVALDEIDAHFGINGTNTRKRREKRKRHTVGVASYRQHAERCAISLQRAGYKVVVYATSEPQAYSDSVEVLLHCITLIDPYWRLIGFPLVVMARKRLP